MVFHLCCPKEHRADFLCTIIAAPTSQSCPHPASLALCSLCPCLFLFSQLHEEGAVRALQRAAEIRLGDEAVRPPHRASQQHLRLPVQRSGEEYQSLPLSSGLACPCRVTDPGIQHQWEGLAARGSPDSVNFPSNVPGTGKDLPQEDILALVIPCLKV